MAERKRYKKHFSINAEYKECFDFLMESKNFVYSAILIFFIFAALGFFFEDVINIVVKEILNINLNLEILDYLRQILAQTEGMSHRQLVGFIFLNNVQSSFFGMFLGIFLGIMPLISLILNGYVLGFVSMLSVESQGFLVLWRILPHGIFELPAVFVSLGIGLRLGAHVFKYKKKESFWKLALNCLKVFLLVVFPLLVLAALIEGSLIAFFS